MFYVTLKHVNRLGNETSASLEPIYLQSKHWFLFEMTTLGVHNKILPMGFDLTEGFENLSSVSRSVKVEVMKLHPLSNFCSGT